MTSWHRGEKTWATNDAMFGPPNPYSFLITVRRFNHPQKTAFSQPGEKSWEHHSFVVSEQSPSDKSGPKRRVEDWSVKWKVSWPNVGIFFVLSKTIGLLDISSYMWDGLNMGYTMMYRHLLLAT